MRQMTKPLLKKLLTTLAFFALSSTALAFESAEAFDAWRKDVNETASLPEKCMIVPTVTISAKTADPSLGSISLMVAEASDNSSVDSSVESQVDASEDDSWFCDSDISGNTCSTTISYISQTPSVTLAGYPAEGSEIDKVTVTTTTTDGSKTTSEVADTFEISDLDLNVASVEYTVYFKKKEIAATEEGPKEGDKQCQLEVWWNFGSREGTSLEDSVFSISKSLRLPVDAGGSYYSDNEFTASISKLPARLERCEPEDLEKLAPLTFSFDLTKKDPNHDFNLVRIVDGIGGETTWPSGRAEVPIIFHRNMWDSISGTIYVRIEYDQPYINANMSTDYNYVSISYHKKTFRNGSWIAGGH